MTSSYLPLSLLIAVLGPLLALHYIQAILKQVLTLLCPAPGGAEFWCRVIRILSISGSLLLVLCFVDTGKGAELDKVLRHTLTLVVLGVFFSIAVVARTLWSQVQQWLRLNRSEVIES